MKAHRKLVLLAAGALLLVPGALAQSNDAPGNIDGPLTERPLPGKANQKSAPAEATPQPSEAGESSSNDTKIDLRPPMGDLSAHPEGGHVADEVLHQQKPWNPMRAMKDVEVGDFYYRNGNYKGAIARYRDALEYKPRDADATLKLARTLEKTKAFDEARARYQEYLTIFNYGPGAEEARKALERLQPAEGSNSSRK
jgi:tetratricopeptide (TPR) repeat protein